MSLNNLKLDNDVVVDESDVVVGGNAFTVPSGIYRTKIDMAYMGESTNGAISLTLITTVNGVKVQEIMYLTNARKEPFYIDKVTKAKKIMPSLQNANNLAQLTNGKDLSDLSTDKRFVMQWDNSVKKDVNTEVDVVVDLLDKPIQAVIQQIKEDQQSKGADGIYRPNGKTRTINKYVKFLDADKGLTVLELESSELPDPTYATTWLKANDGKLRDMSTAGADTSANAGGTSSTDSTKSLFSS